jgi:hypothetical protein
MEVEVEESVVVGLSDGFNKQAIGTYVDGVNQVVYYAKDRRCPAEARDPSRRLRDQ